MSKETFYQCELCGKPTPAQNLTWALVEDVCRTCFEPWRRGHNSAIQVFKHRMRFVGAGNSKNTDATCRRQLQERHRSRDTSNS